MQKQTGQIQNPRHNTKSGTSNKPTKIQFTIIKTFEKELKKLKKRFRTLDSDLTLIKLIIEKFPKGEDSRHAHTLKANQEQKLYIIKRRLVSKSTKHNDFRIVYAFNESTNTITFVEIYFKGMQSNHNIKRVEEIWQEIQD